jgi:hypothetical protein
MQNNPTRTGKCASCGNYLPAHYVGAALGIGIVVAVFFWVIFVNRDSESEKPAPTPPAQASTRSVDPEYGRGITIQTCTQMYVESMLKSPSTADHPWVLASDIVTKISEGKYRVRSYVDAENAYGAMLRAYYSCDVSLSNEECSSVVCKFDE